MNDRSPIGLGGGQLLVIATRATPDSDRTWIAAIPGGRSFPQRWLAVDALMALQRARVDLTGMVADLKRLAAHFPLGRIDEPALKELPDRESSSSPTTALSSSLKNSP